MGALDAISSPDDLGDALQDSQQNPSVMPAALVQDAPADVEARKQILQNATQRILQQRDQIMKQPPYGGNNLGDAAAMSSLLSAGGTKNPLGGLGAAIAAKPQAEEQQRQANLQQQNQALSLDLRGKLAQIMQSGVGGDPRNNLQNMFGMGALMGDKDLMEGSGRMLGATNRGMQSKAMTVMNEKGQPEVMSAYDAAQRGLAPAQYDKNTGVLLNGKNGAGGVSSPVTPAVASIFNDASLPANPGQPTKDDIKNNDDQYKGAVASDDAARGASKVASQVQDKLKNYWSGSWGSTAANMDAALPDWAQSLGAQNTQYMNKNSGQIAMQIAQQSHGIRIGVGMEKFAKSTTIDPINAAPVNQQIVQNIEDLPYITQQQKDMMSYTKQFPAQHKNAIEDSFYQQYPLMLDAKSDDPNSVATINPAYKDPQLFRKFLRGLTPNDPSTPQHTGAIGVQSPAITPSKPVNEAPNAGSAPPKLQALAALYKTPQDIKAAYQNGKMSREDARTLLQNTHGYQ